MSLNLFRQFLELLVVHRLRVGRRHPLIALLWQNFTRDLPNPLPNSLQHVQLYFNRLQNFSLRGRIDHHDAVQVLVDVVQAPQEGLIGWLALYVDSGQVVVGIQLDAFEFSVKLRL